MKYIYRLINLFRLLNLRIMNTFTKTVSLLCFCALTANATTYRVNNTGGISANFTTLQDAHDGAQNGDTLIIEGSEIGYSTGYTSTKKLTYIGPGYFLTQNPQTQANLSVANINASISFAAGSAGSVVMGLSFYTDLNISDDNILFKRNYFNTYYDVTISANKSNIVFVQNYFTRANGSYAALNISAGCSNILISNNFFENTSTHYTIYMTGGSATISNNVFRGKCKFMNSVVKNNIFAVSQNTVTETTCSFTNNLCDATQLADSVNNLRNVDMATVFQGSGTGISTDAQWKLKTASPAIAYGANGEDCGLYGGIDPYVLSGMPPVPSIYYFSAPSTGSASQGLPVHIRARSHK